VTPPDLAPPTPTLAIDGEDVARVEQFAARQRAELGRLSLILRKALRRAEQAEQAERDTPIEAPGELLAVFDSMIEEAVRTAEVAIEAARSDAGAIVAAEHARAAFQLVSLGLDPLLALGPVGWTSDAIAHIARPTSASSLWEDVEAHALAAGSTVGEDEPPSGSDHQREREAAGSPDRHADRLDLFDDADFFDDLSCIEDPELAEDPELFEALWGCAARRRAVPQLVPAGLGRPPPGRPTEPTEREFDRSRTGAPMDAFPSRWPDSEQAERDFPRPPDRQGAPAPMPRRPDDAEPFDVFWRGPELFDVFWGDTEDRRPIRDRLRRRVTQEHR
jgi:hypothetical protein